MEDQYELLKRKSEEKILGWGGEILAHLPLLDSLEDVSPMPAADVARRALVLCRFAAIGYGGPAEELTTGLKEYGLWDAASTRERTLLESGNFTEQNIIDFTWRTEAIQALAWTLGLVELDPHRYCDDDLASNFPEANADSFIASSSLKPIDEIQKQADLLYRMHWCARNRGRGGESLSQDLPFSESVIRERRQAVDWVYGVEPDWDEVPLDT